MPEAPYQLLPEHPITRLPDYEAAGGGRGLAKAMASGRDEVIEEIRRSGLRGRGGAGFPTGIKWRGVADAVAEDGVAYVACNAAEGEPGTYKDRPLMARNPYQLIEGVLIALHTLRAERAYIATKERFTEEAGRLVEARDEMVAAGWSRAGDVEIVLGPDEYLFGEEKALLEVIEGRLPMPRLVPPFQVGLWATTTQPNPTVVNNVETFCHVTRIMSEGATAFREVGTDESPGTMLFTVSGDVPNGGVFELPLGTPLRTLVCDIGGAAAGDVQAIWSGVSNVVITPDLLDLPMDFDSFAEAGLGLGSGGFVVYDRTRDMVQVTAQLSRFLAIESCGQCNACKLGNLFMAERFDKLVRGQGTRADLDAIAKRTLDVTDQNRCYLPVGAALVVRSALDTFRDAFDARLGSPTPEDVKVPVPKIVDVDEDEGVVHFDTEYHRKRPDWSYAKEGDGQVWPR
jgi:NADH-quinone oxidoreductase subunit F